MFSLEKLVSSNACGATIVFWFEMKLQKILVELSFKVL